MWITVTDFDRDVKVGDKIRNASVINKYLPEVVLWVSKIDGPYFLAAEGKCRPKVWPKIDRDGWQVWRETVLWRADDSNHFYYFSYNSVLMAQRNYIYEQELFQSGNYFRTQEQAQRYADECKKVADKLHEEFGE